MTNMTSASQSNPRPALTFDQTSRDFIDPALPSNTQYADSKGASRPFVTLTYAQSLDSSLSLAPGTRTTLSGAETKAMTHYLRSKHDAILVGVGTAVADDPALNCRIEDAVDNLDMQPRPVVLDPTGRWDVLNSECFRLAKAGRGKAPWIFVSGETSGESHAQKYTEVERVGGKYISIESLDGTAKSLSWDNILEKLTLNGIKSIMIEGGGRVIESLLHPDSIGLVDSVIITIAPTWLGRGGVLVSPEKRSGSHAERMSATRLTETRWRQFGEDVVLCGRILI